MAERERLIELLNIAVGDCNLTDPEIKIVADYLIDNGVIVPPCKVGDYIWLVFTPIPQKNLVKKYSSLKRKRKKKLKELKKQ